VGSLEKRFGHDAQSPLLRQSVQRSLRRNIQRGIDIETIRIEIREYLNEREESHSERIGLLGKERK
jgi:hypothetical protein